MPKLTHMWRSILWRISGNHAILIMYFIINHFTNAPTQPAGGRGRNALCNKKRYL